jgi:putative ABC transport system permease protein
MKGLHGGIAENLRLALDAVRSRKLRSFLSVLGVVIGVVTVMTIASIISGIDYAVAKQIEALGVNSIFLHKYDASRASLNFLERTREERMRKSLTFEDAIAIGAHPGHHQ